MPTVDQARQWYPASDPVHGFDHILRVYHMVCRLAQAEGADLEIVGAAALLHDADGSQAPIAGQSPGSGAAGALLTGQNSAGQRAAHQHASAAFAARLLADEGWSEERIEAVLHCIRSHRFRDHSEPPRSIEARVLFDADKLDAIGAIGAARAIAYAAQQGQPAFALPSELFMATGRLEPGEPHSAYHEYCFKLSRIHDRLHTPSARRIAADRHQWMVEFFERLKSEAAGDR